MVLRVAYLTATLFIFGSNPLRLKHNLMEEKSDFCVSVSVDSLTFGYGVCVNTMELTFCIELFDV